MLVGLDLWSIERLYWNFSAPAAQLYASDPAIDYMARVTDPGRVVVLDIRQLGGTDPGDPALSGCSGGTGGPSLMVHRVRNVTGCHGNEIGRFQRFGEYQEGVTNAYNPARFLSTAGAHHENVHFLLTNAAGYGDGSHRAPAAGWPVHARSRTRPDCRRFDRASVSGSPEKIRLPGWPDPIVAADSEQALATVISPSFDPGRAAIVDPGSRRTNCFNSSGSGQRPRPERRRRGTNPGRSTSRWTNPPRPVRRSSSRRITFLRGTQQRIPGRPLWRE